MVEIDIRDHRDPRAQEAQRAVGLVALGDEPALPRSAVAAELRHVAADQEGRIEPEPVEAERDHGGRRRLPVRARDGDRGAKRDELGEQLPARGESRTTSSGLSAEIAEDTITSHPSGTFSAAWPSVTAIPCARRRSTNGVRGAVGAGHLRPPPLRDERERAHAGAPDPDEPEPPACERRRRPLSAPPSAISSSATTSAASGRASARIESAIAGEPRARRRVAPSLDAEGRAPAPARGLRPRPLEVTRVLCLVLRRRVRVRDEQGRLAGGRDLPDHPPARETTRSAAASAAPKSSVNSSSP